MTGIQSATPAGRGSAAPAPTAAVKSEWWRAVLGEYPTGVTLITARDEQDNAVGMVVGTFTAISQDPPLVGFFPDRLSTSFPTIAASGRFTASVLGRSHELLCRAFATKAPDRFKAGSFDEAPSGQPRVADAVAWFDATIVSRTNIGDHELVIGAVEDFGVGTADAGLPLLFRRGGYGSFAPPSVAFDSEVLGRQLRFVDQAGELVSALASRTEKGVAVSALVQDAVVVLAAAEPGSATTPAGRGVGSTFPFAAPLAPVFVAWASAESQTAWMEAARHLIGSVDRPAFAALLESVRRRGFGVSPAGVVGARFRELMTQDGTSRASFAELWSATAAEPPLIDDVPAPGTVSAIQAPVFGPLGAVEVVLTVDGFVDLRDAREFTAAADLVLETAARITHRIGGRIPPEG